MSKKEISFLFGAGAEMQLGMPSGQNFAIDILFKKDKKSKNEFKNLVLNLKNDDLYEEWLGLKFKENKISEFNNQDIKSIFKSTLEANGHRIINEINLIFENQNFIKMIHKDQDNNFYNEIKNIIYYEKFKNEIYTNINIKDKKYEDFFQMSLFEKNAFKFILDIFIYINSESNEENESQMKLKYEEIWKNYSWLEKEQIRRKSNILIKAIMQMYAGSKAKNIINYLTNQLFKTNNIQLDDMTNIVKFNYDFANYNLFEEIFQNDKSFYKNDIIGQTFLALNKIVEKIYGNVVDYRSLIDSHWGFLYEPSRNWAKFCKISIFLIKVKNYIYEKTKNIEIKNQNSYYDDINKLKNTKNFIYTTNYGNIIKEKIKLKNREKIIFLNGSIDEYYDPYFNKIHNINTNNKQILVPLLFTQSGTKPMTSIEKILEYSSTYQQWIKSDSLVIVGFGFNNDDEHINNMIRHLYDKYKKENKKIFIIDIYDENDENYYANKIKIENYKNNDGVLEIVIVDKKNRTKNNKLWIDYIR